MADMKDFELDLNAATDGDDGNGKARISPLVTVTPYTPYTVYSLIGISNATTQFGGDASYTESKCY